MKEFRLQGWHVLAGVIAFFAVVVVVNAIFISAALRSFPGQEEQKPYFQGLRYNDVLEERRQQSMLGWRVEINQADRRADGAGVIELLFLDEKGDPLDGLNVTGALERPAADAGRPLAFADMGGGRYRAIVEGLDSGVWDFDAEAVSSAGDRFEATARIVFK